MKWIFALNQNSNADYETFVRVAVHSARQKTRLQPVCLYDGAPSPLTRWLEDRGVEIVPCRSAFAEELRRIAQKRGDEGIYRVGAGTFLRFELPRLARERAWNDEHVLYTDCDVLFERDPQPLLESLRPRFFAAAPEIHRAWPLHMNAGVLWIHLRGWASVETKLNAFTRRHLERLLSDSFDQGALRAFFNPPHRFLLELGAPPRLIYALLTRWPTRTFRWDVLPDAMNWKPYWGQNSDAFIAHFHGPKPINHLGAANVALPPALAQLQNQAWRNWCARWQAVRAETEAEAPGDRQGKRDA